MAFYNTELTGVRPLVGWQGQPEFKTRISLLANGHERRNAQASLVRHRYTLPFANIEDKDYLLYLKGAFLAMRGQLHSFLIKDWADNMASDEPLGVAPSGTTPVQLTKLSTFGLASYTRVITKPMASVVVKQGGVAKAGALDTSTGLFTPSTAWTEGAALSWSGPFRVSVRFASDALAMSINSRTSSGNLHSGSVELIEVFGE